MSPKRDGREGAEPTLTAATRSRATSTSSDGAVVITPSDHRYPDVVRGLNQRFVGRPEAVHLANSTGQVLRAVQDAVDNGKRITVRSGGHCYEDFVFNPAVQVVIDMSAMNAVYFDPMRNAVAVEAGATLLRVYHTLYKLWGVTIPAGVCYSVGMGGHVTGGGWGMLSRQHGLVSDHLYAVEVVVVDESRRVRTVVATREEDDPNRELWWAHTGAGGGNFGVVTRFWFRSPGAVGATPSALLPKPPQWVLLSALGWLWDDLSEEGFANLVKNYDSWQVANKDPDSPHLGLSSWLVLFQKGAGMPEIAVLTQVDDAAPNARRVLDDYLTEINRGVQGAGAPGAGTNGGIPAPRELPWLQATSYLSTMHQVLTDPTLRAEYKSAYVRNNLPDHQIDILYRHLTRPDFINPYAFVQFTPFGGKVNAVAPDATASAHRDSAYQLHWQAMWTDPADDATNIAWARDFYEEMFADTGGVPVPNELTDGCYISYPDIDLSEGPHNSSLVPWHYLYYKENYPRLQEVKGVWDPLNIFHHAQSIRLPSPQSR